MWSPIKSNFERALPRSNNSPVTANLMVAEIRATLPDNSEVIPAPVADNTFTVAVTGKRNTVTVAATQGQARCRRLLRKTRRTGYESLLPSSSEC
jgi:hypothetical protein